MQTATDIPYAVFRWNCLFLGSSTLGSSIRAIVFIMSLCKQRSPLFAFGFVELLCIWQKVNRVKWKYWTSNQRKSQSQSSFFSPLPLLLPPLFSTINDTYTLNRTRLCATDKSSKKKNCVREFPVLIVFVARGFMFDVHNTCSGVSMWQIYSANFLQIQFQADYIHWIESIFTCNHSPCASDYEASNVRSLQKYLFANKKHTDDVKQCNFTDLLLIHFKISRTQRH